jgi:hypothetical protein
MSNNSLLIGNLNGLTAHASGFGQEIWLQLLPVRNISYRNACDRPLTANE